MQKHAKHQGIRLYTPRTREDRQNFPSYLTSSEEQMQSSQRSSLETWQPQERTNNIHPDCCVKETQAESWTYSRSNITAYPLGIPTAKQYQ